MHESALSEVMIVESRQLDHKRCNLIATFKQQRFKRMNEKATRMSFGVQVSTESEGYHSVAPRDHLKDGKDIVLEKTMHLGHAEGPETCNGKAVAVLPRPGVKSTKRYRVKIIRGTKVLSTYGRATSMPWGPCCLVEVRSRGFRH